jgi:hypothetical protein
VTAAPPVTHTGRNAAIVILAVLLVVSFVAFVPIPHSFSSTLATVSPAAGVQAGATQLYFPEGSTVSGTYSTTLGLSEFAILNATFSVVWSGAGSTGSFNFVANSSAYYAIAVSLALGGVTVSGTYSVPLLSSLT